MSNPPPETPPPRPARFAIDHGSPHHRADVHVITVTGDLDAVAATRLLRLIDARLRLCELSIVRTDHIVIDLGPAHRITATAMTVLHVARDAALRHHVDLLLAGTIAFAALPLPVRQALRQFLHFPTLAAALTALDQRHASRTDTDRDARP